MSDSDTTTNRHELRKTLLANGYRPLPLQDKGIRIKGWVADDITEEWIDKFRRNGKCLNTGIRCDDLIAFDIDVYDEALADRIEELIEEQIGQTDLCRVGQWPKRLLLYRLKGDTPGKSRRTAKYGDAGHQVELLCTRGRQFAAFGTHPKTGQPYEWLDGHSPLAIAQCDIPAVTADEAQRTLNEVALLLESTGLPIHGPGGELGACGGHVYDMIPETPVEYEGTVTTWGEIRDYLTPEGGFGNLMREHGEFGDSNGVHFFLAHGSGEPCAFDFTRDCVHWDDLQTEKLAELLPEPPAAADDPFNPPELRDMMADCVILADDTMRRLSAPTVPIKINGFVRMMKYVTVPDPSPPRNNPNKTIQATTLWLQSPESLRAERYQMRPDKPACGVFQLGGAKVLNTYSPPPHDAPGGDLDVWNEFIEHLIPKKAERQLFINWLATKVARPQLRLHGFVMVTPAFGTGRGTLSKILAKLFGKAYTHTVALKDLVSDKGQSEYKEFLADSLLISVPEARTEDEQGNTWASRHAAYEQLKQVIDPGGGEMRIKRKYGGNSIEELYCSVLVQSNHAADALAIEPGDRRLIVIDNGLTPLVDAPDNLVERINDWHDSAANIAALHHHLLSYVFPKTNYDPFGMPPMTPAKERMIDASRSPLDQAFSYMLEQIEGDIVTAAQWRQFAFESRQVLEIDLPTGDKLDKGLAVVLKQRAFRCDGLKGKPLSMGGTTVRPWIVRNVKDWLMCSDTRLLREEIQKNGDPGAAVVPLQKV